MGINYKDENVYVKNSELHGYGIFASRYIKEGEEILIIHGEVIDEAECIRRENDENNVYIFWNEDYYIDTTKSIPIKYINHDCNCNCIVEDRDEFTLSLIALKDILPDEELTIDYGYEEIYDLCGCNKCKENEN